MGILGTWRNGERSPEEGNGEINFANYMGPFILLLGSNWYACSHIIRKETRTGKEEKNQKHKQIIVLLADSC